MPSPQKTISTRTAIEADSSESEEEVCGLLERDYEGVTQLESMLLEELFSHFAGLGGLLQAVEDDGGRALADSLSKNEKLLVKVGKFASHRAGQESSADGDAYSKS